MQIIFSAVFAILFLTILTLALTKRGRNKGIGFMFGEVVEDLGPLKEQRLRLGKQTTRQLHCRHDGEDFLVLETTDSMPGAVQSTWTKIDEDMLKTINSLVTL